MKMVIRTLVTLMISLVLLLPSPASAVSSKQRAVVSPSSIELALRPGESVTKAITVVNKGTEPFMLTMAASPYSVQGQEYTPLYTPLANERDASAWMTIASTTAVRVEPEKLKEISYTVSVPLTAQPGTYYAAVFATTTPDPLPGSVVVHNRVAVVHYITVTGTRELMQEGQVYVEPPKTLLWGGALALPHVVKNTGEGYFLAKVSAVVKTIWGSEVSHMHEERYVLPQTERNITLEWQAKSAFGIYRVEQSADYLGHTEQLSSRWIVVMQPVVVVGSALVVAGCCVLLVIRTQHRRRRVFL